MCGCVSSSVVTSCSRQLHEAVADLLMWSDKILLNGDMAAVNDTQQASDVINAVKCAVSVRCSLPAISIATATATLHTFYGLFSMDNLDQPAPER